MGALEATRAVAPSGTATDIRAFYDGLGESGCPWLSHREVPENGIAYASYLTDESEVLGTMSMEDAVCTIHRDDNDDLFVVVDGMKIAKRAGPDTALAMTWIMLEPGWIVRDIDSRKVEVRFEGARIH